MNILVVNDDGYNATGIKILINFLKDYGRIFVVAPKKQMSAKSHSITLYDKVSIEKIDLCNAVEAYMVDGTPADCVNIGLYMIKDKIDLVVSGINDGYNLGCDINYSGTCSAALEASNNGLKSVAFSTKRGYFEILDDLKFTFEEILRKGYLEVSHALNVNFPPQRSKGIKLTFQGKKVWHTAYKEENGYYYPYSEAIKQDDTSDCDCQAVVDGYTSITPLMLDKTDYAYLHFLRQKKEE